MSQLLSVRGGRRLEGEVTIQGAKNSVLPILAATLLARGQVALLGCPRLRDVDASIRILRHLGCDAHWEADALAVDTTALRRCEISDVLMREMRSSAIFLGAILARCGQADLSYPGGCELGPRPIDLHLAGLRDLGAEIREEGGFLHCRADRLRGREVVLRMPSVGATENLMLAACGAEGVTVISNAAREPEVVDLQNFLNACGARVSGAGSSAVSIEGGQDLHGCTYRVMPDRIAAATYLCAAASAGGDIYLRGAEEGHLSTVTAALREAGCTVTADSGGIRALCRERLRAVGPVQTAPYPGFPTDAQAVLMAALLRSRGATGFEENIFENRYRHVDELIRMGASIRVSGRVAVVTGVERLHSAPVRCTDLRGGAALCVAALAAEGETRVSQICHIDRGYEDLARDLRALGARCAWKRQKTGRRDDMARRRHSNRRRRRGNFGFLYKLLSVLVICAAMVMALTLFFRVDTIEVTGTERYTEKDVIEASGIQLGDNLFLLNKYEAARSIAEQLPYIDIEDIRIRRELPDTLLIDVAECGTPLAVIQDGSAWLLSPKGKIVEQLPASQAGDYAVIDGCELLAPSVGTDIALSTEFANQQTSLLALLAALDAAGLTDRVDAIHLDDLSRLTMDYAGRFSVEMEYNADYDRMLQILEAGISKLESNQTGSIRLDLNPPILTLD